jgi:hypothetical protein
MSEFNYNLEGETVYVLELDQPFENYFAEVIKDKGDLLYVSRLEDGQRVRDVIRIDRSQVHSVIDEK